ncbi:DedA family protein, partial [Burkholderia multivorans]
METLGPLGVGFLVFLDNIFPPIPSELVLPLAGFTARRGQLSLVLAIVFATIGSVVGAVLLYAIGRWIGLDRIVRVAVKMPLVDVADVHKTVSWFDRHGDKAVFFGRMIPIFRSL